MASAEWVKSVLEEYSKALGVPEHWVIQLVEDDLLKHEGVYARVEYNVETITAIIRYPDDMEENDRARQSLMHELLHICLAFLTSFITKNKKTALIVEEQVVTLMSRALVAALKNEN